MHNGNECPFFSGGKKDLVGYKNDNFEWYSENGRYVDRLWEDEKKFYNDKKFPSMSIRQKPIKLGKNWTEPIEQNVN